MSRPNCPRCSGFLIPASFVDGITCIHCGHLIERVVVPAPIPVSPVSNMAVRDVMHELVIKYLDSINRQLASGSTWVSITRLMSIAEGRKLSEKTIQKHYRELCNE